MIFRTNTPLDNHLMRHGELTGGFPSGCIVTFVCEDNEEPVERLYAAIGMNAGFAPLCETSRRGNSLYHRMAWVSFDSTGAPSMVRQTVPDDCLHSYQLTPGIPTEAACKLLSVLCSVYSLIVMESLQGLADPLASQLMTYLPMVQEAAATEDALVIIGTEELYGPSGMYWRGDVALRENSEWVISMAEGGTARCVWSPVCENFEVNLCLT